MRKKPDPEMVNVAISKVIRLVITLRCGTVPLDRRLSAWASATVAKAIIALSNGSEGERHRWRESQCAGDQAGRAIGIRNHCSKTEMARNFEGRMAGGRNDRERREWKAFILVRRDSTIRGEAHRPRVAL
jgi:hypothetical protein